MFAGNQSTAWQLTGAPLRVAKLPSLRDPLNRRELLAAVASLSAMAIVAPPSYADDVSIADVEVVPSGDAKKVRKWFFCVLVSAFAVAAVLTKI